MSLSLRHLLHRRASARDAAESWFLERGLPAVLTRRGRWRRLWSRSAPMVVAYGTLQACTVPIFLITDGHDVDIQGEPTTTEWVILAILGITPLLMVAVGWLVSRWLSHSRQRAVTATTAAAVAILVEIVESDHVAHLPLSILVMAVILILTASGLGSVLGWAMRTMLSHLATVGALAVRALPVVLLTALVFFNTYVWIMAATITGERLWLAIMFLVGIASAFVVSATLDRVKPMLKSTVALPKDAERLADTPFSTMPDASPSQPLTRAERLNVVFVMATSQLVQIGVVAVVTATIYLGLGLIVLSPALLKEWTHTAVSSVALLGMTLPAPDSLIHMCLFLGALTFMYISARAVGDAEYRATFFDPLMDDLHTTLIARNRYRGAIATATAARRSNGCADERPDRPTSTDVDDVDVSDYLHPNARRRDARTSH